MIFIADRIKQKTLDLESDNAKLRKALTDSQKKSSQIPDLKSTIKALQEQVILARSQLSTTTDTGTYLLTEKSLKDSKKKYESLKKEFDVLQKSHHDADLRLEKLFFELEMPMLTKNLHNIRMTDKIINLEKLMLEFKLKFAGVQALDSKNQSLEQEVGRLRENENSQIKKELG
jgi:hypothetical protein